MYFSAKAAEGRSSERIAIFFKDVWVFNLQKRFFSYLGNLLTVKDKMLLRLNLPCLAETTFTFSHLADAFIQSDLHSIHIYTDGTLHIRSI